MVFDVAGESLSPTIEENSPELLEQWWQKMLAHAKQQRAEASRTGKLTTKELEQLARQTFASMSEQAAMQDGIDLPESWLSRLLGELSGLGDLLDLITDDAVEDVAVNLNHLWAYRTGQGWEYVGEASDGFANGLRVMMDDAGAKPPTPNHPVVDAVIQVMVPTPDGETVRKGLRINYVMPPISPYGDIITIRVANYSRDADLARFTRGRLPPDPYPPFSPPEFPRGDGALSPEAATYLLGVLVRGGVVVVAGPTGSGKTTLSKDLLQGMLDAYPRGAIRLFIIEDSNEIVLNGWDGDPTSDTGNVVYTVTRPEIPGGPPPVTAYDLIRAALRSRPHGIVVGEARGPEAWELARAASTGHGHAIFTIHATSAEGVWPRFVQAVQGHPEVRNLPDWTIAQAFAEAVTAVVYIERHPRIGQHVGAIAEVSEIVERSAGRPALTTLFRWDEQNNTLQPTGNRPMRAGFRTQDLNVPESFFRSSSVR